MADRDEEQESDFDVRTRRIAPVEVPLVTKRMAAMQRPSKAESVPLPPVRPPTPSAAATDMSLAEPAPPSTPIQTVPTVGDRIGKYVVDRVIGAGGMGLVVSARDDARNETVAIKLLRPKAAGDKVHAERFAREARAIVKITSEHVVRVFDAGTLDGGAPFIVMEYLVGRDLAQILRADGPVPVTRAADLMLQICEAVASAHAVGVVHRDLKPSNFFVIQRSEGTPLVKVLDFGISKAIGQDGIVDHNLTETQAVFGSPTYMSPEQIRSAKHVDNRSDVWSLGVAFYEMLTGKLPFAADNVAGLLASIIADPPYYPRAFSPSLPEALEELLLECLAKDPRQRVQSAADLAFRIAPFATPSAETQSLVDGIDRLARASGQSTTTGPKLPLSQRAAPAPASVGRLPPGPPVATQSPSLPVLTPPPAQSQSYSHSGFHAARNSAAPFGSTGTDLSAEAVPRQRNNALPIGIGLVAALVVIVGGGAFLIGRRGASASSPAPATVEMPAPPSTATTTPSVATSGGSIPSSSESAPLPPPNPPPRASGTNPRRPPVLPRHPPPRPAASAPAPKPVDPTNDRF